jgi:predicted nucleic acid-binding protein
MTPGPLVDTGVLIDYFGGVHNAEADLLDELLEHGPPPATAPIILQEFLQGFTKPRDFEQARLCLEPFDHLDPPGYDQHRRAAELHVGLKRKGLTTSSADALIVASARAAGRPLLTRDKAQRALAEHAGVAIEPRRT